MSQSQHTINTTARLNLEYCISFFPMPRLPSTWTCAVKKTQRSAASILKGMRAYLTTVSKAESILNGFLRINRTDETPMGKKEKTS